MGVIFLKIIYLGTGASEAVPAMFCQCKVCETARKNLGKEYRNRSGVVINGTLLIDVPPDIFNSSIRAGIDMTEIRDIFITHSHSDHCDAYELSARASRVTAYRTESGNFTTHVYGNQKVKEKLSIPENIKELDYNYIEPFKTYEIYGNISVTPLLTTHMKDEECYIYLIDNNNKRFLYGNDTGLFPEPTMKYLQNMYVDVISLDCTYVMMKSEYGHMGIDANYKLKNLLIKQKTADEKTVFIAHHFSHNGFFPDGRYYSLDEFEQISGVYGFKVSYDAMTIDI